MSQLGTTDRSRTAIDNRPPPAAQTSLAELFTFNQETLRRITGLIQLSFGILNGVIALRFLLKLMAANPDNPFASFIYIITAPFLWIFSGLTRNPSFEGIVIEFHDLIAIGVYAMLGWVIIRVIWLLFAHVR
ncbi:MAG: YggT family protein [Chloroflexi bacterium]|nr:YggT family protein [Chloroflexota bacterium]MBI3338768.1 YggT family protein [Chloroflexota bacterium]